MRAPGMRSAKRLARLDPERHVAIAPHDRGRHGDLLEPRPGVDAGLALVVGHVVAQDRPVHRHRELARRPADPALGRGRTVEPQVRVQPQLRVDVAGLARRDEPLDDPHRVLVEPVRLGLPVDRRRDQHQPGQPLGDRQRRVERQRAAHRVADEPDRLVRDGVEHRRQVLQVRVGRRRGRRVAEPAPVIGDRRRRQLRRDRAPRAPVRHAGVQEHDRRALAVPPLAGERDAAGPHVEARTLHAASLKRDCPSCVCR